VAKPKEYTINGRTYCSAIGYHVIGEVTVKRNEKDRSYSATNRSLKIPSTNTNDRFVITVCSTKTANTAKGRLYDLNLTVKNKTSLKIEKMPTMLKGKSRNKIIVLHVRKRSIAGY
jgi:hypothetical protein